MSSKFASCTLAQLYRRITPSGRVLGGPMVYLEEGLKEQLGNAAIGKVFGIIFAIFVILGSFGGGNLFQANQAFVILKEQVPAWLRILGSSG